MNNLSKLLTVFLTVTLFIGPMFSDQLRSEETGYTPTTLITGANRGIGLEFTKQYLQCVSIKQFTKLEFRDKYSKSKPILLFEPLYPRE